MQAVILAAGEGKRLRPLTLERPKPLVRLAGRPLLDHIAAALPVAINELIIVVGYRGEQIIEHCGKNYFGRPVRYCRQKELGGNALALRLAAPLLHQRFLVLFADDLVDKPSIENALRHELAVLVSEHCQPQNFGVVVTNPDDTVVNILEKPSEPPSNTVLTSVSILTKEIFEHISPGQPGAESYLSHAIARLAQTRPVHASPMRGWHPIGRPEDIEQLEKIWAGPLP